ncbi:MAG: hypothetical protein ACOZB3_13010 [Calditrichota bacterium]
MIRLLLVCAATLWTILPLMAQEKSTATDYSIRIASVETETQARIEALASEIENTDPATRDAVGRQIEQLKREGEIRRLEILLEWAQTDGDARRISEAEHALNQWRNPPQTQELPELPKNENPGSINNASRTGN